jgi:hypothetical protein
MYQWLRLGRSYTGCAIPVSYMRFCFFGLLLIPAVTLLAQQSSTDKAAATSTVTGHVYCADTNAPARMATVMLEPAEAADAHSSGGHGRVSTYVSAVQTLLDGSFSIAHVAPGSYYVIASEPGYVSALASLGVSVVDLQKPDDTLKDKIAKVPRITVQPNLPAAIDVTLERGAAVSGTVLFDDGSPAGGLEVHLLARKKDEWAAMEFGPFETSAQAQTDDRGAYRISGLPAREYLVEVDLHLAKKTYEFDGHGNTGMSSDAGYSLPIYSGGSWRKKDAAAVSLKSGEDRAGEDIQIPLSQLHSVRGAITAARDGHVVNGGSVSLIHADDKSQAVSTRLTKDDNGFAFSFIPEGDYILRVSGAADIEYEEIPNPPHSVPPTRSEEHTLHRYGNPDQAIHIDRDLSGLTIAVPELPEKAQANP